MPRSITAPHGGVIYPLAEGRGHVELLAERKGDSRDRNAESEIIAYFLNMSGKGAMDPAPTEVKVAFKTSGSKLIPLTLTPGSGDAYSSARFVSPSGKYGSDELIGKLEATVAGAPASVPFQLR